MKISYVIIRCFSHVPGPFECRWNAHSVAFTLNYLSPYAVDVHGIGRNFISRDLLRATNMADAVRRATVSHPHATGHNFQLLSFSEGLLSNVEAAPHGLFKVDTPSPHVSPPSTLVT